MRPIIILVIVSQLTACQSQPTVLVESTQPAQTQLISAQEIISNKNEHMIAKDSQITVEMKVVKSDSSPSSASNFTNDENVEPLISDEKPQKWIQTIQEIATESSLKEKHEANKDQLILEMPIPDELIQPDPSWKFPLYSFSIKENNIIKTKYIFDFQRKIYIQMNAMDHYSIYQLNERGFELAKTFFDQRIQ